MANLKYIGQGSFLHGVPARDLSEAEAAQYGGEQKLIASGLYAKAEPGEPATPVRRVAKGGNS
jgi:hypothetical protein